MIIIRREKENREFVFNCPGCGCIFMEEWEAVGVAAKTVVCDCPLCGLRVSSPQGLAERRAEYWKSKGYTHPKTVDRARKPG